MKDFSSPCSMCSWPNAPRSMKGIHGCSACSFTEWELPVTLFPGHEQPLIKYWTPTSLPWGGSPAHSQTRMYQNQPTPSILLHQPHSTYPLPWPISKIAWPKLSIFFGPSLSSTTTSPIRVPLPSERQSPPQVSHFSSLTNLIPTERNLFSWLPGSFVESHEPGKFS